MKCLSTIPLSCFHSSIVHKLNRRVTRIFGHRFRVNNITCRPVLPLLLTTSHHNVINNHNGQLLFREKKRTCSIYTRHSSWPLSLIVLDKEVYGTSSKKIHCASGLANHCYCSELILWKVERLKDRFQTIDFTPWLYLGAGCDG